MRGGWVRRVACVSVGVIAAICFGIGDASAQDSTESIQTESVSQSDLAPVADAHAQLAEILPPQSESSAGVRRFGEILAYAGIDGWRYGGSAYVGAQWSASQQSLFVLRIFASDGVDDFRTRFDTYRSETARASLLPGIHVQSGKLDIKLFVGGDYQMRIPLRPVLGAPVQVFGGRATIDAWWEPADNWMLSGSASATTIESGISGRLASGWRTAFGWIGPELLATQDVYNTQYRAGAHLTGLKLGIAEWSVAGGYTRDSFGRSSPYGRFGITLRP